MSNIEKQIVDDAQSSSTSFSYSNTPHGTLNAVPNVPINEDSGVRVSTDETSVLSFLLQQNQMLINSLRTE